MLIRIAFLVPILFLLCTRPGSACQEPGVESERATKIARLLNSYAELDQFSGAVLVAEHGNVIYRGGHGLADRELDVAVDVESRFIIGSMTKAFTAVLAMQAVEAGKLELDKPAQHYWREFQDPTAGQITIRHLLTHRSGLQHWNAIEGFLGNQDRLTYEPEELANLFAGQGTAFPPGEQFVYSSPGYYVLGIVLTKVWQKPYAELLREHIFEPLEMDSSALNDYATLVADRASAYRYNFVKARYDNAEFRDPSTMFSTGGIIANVDDLLKWDQALSGDKLISAETRELIFNPANGRQAFGWHQALPGREGEHIVWHGGLVTGYRSQITRCLDTQRTVILLGNLRDIDTHQVTEGILAILDGETPTAPQRSLMKAVLEAVAENGAAAGVRRFEQIQDHSEAFNTDPTELLRAAVELQSDGEIQSAAVLYAHWLEAYPSSPYREMATQSLAECRRLLQQEQ